MKKWLSLLIVLNNCLTKIQKMKKNYMLLSAGLMISMFGFSQGVAEKFAKDEVQALPGVERTSDADAIYSKSKGVNTKAFRDTAFYEDFDSTTFVSNGWTITNNNTNNAVWQNTGVFTPGQFSGGTPAINSTTSSNGFMLLNGDFINTPIPPTGAITMDTWFTSDTIWLAGANATTPINPNTVWVSYQQYLRYCCSGANQLVLEVSTDGTNWTTYDATAAIPVNAANASTAVAVANNEINITGAVCGANYIFVRFRSTGNSHYYWMIDDFAVIEGPTHELALSQEYMQFNNDSFTFNPFYRRVPIGLFPPLPFSGAVTNNGRLNETNVAIDVDVRHVLDTAGNPGKGLVYSSSAVIGTLTNVCDTTASNALAALTDTPRFIPILLGAFEVDYAVNYDSVAFEELPSNNDALTAFITTDTVYQRDDDGLGGGTGPHRYVIGGTPGGTAAGDRFGLTYVVERSPLVTNDTQMVPTSISYVVNTNTRNIGVEIVPKIWLWDEDSATVNSAFVGEVASSFIPYVVQAGDTNTVLTLGLDNGTAVTNGLDSGQYVVGWEVTSIAGNTTFEVYNDASTAALQPNVTAFLYFGHSPASGWGWVDVNPAIRLNMGKLPTQSTVGINKIETANQTQFYVGPNPNNGIFEVRIQNKQATTYNMNVRNMLGQSVYFDVVGVNGQQIVNMDLSSVDKGVYFVTLENESERLVKKVVLK